MQLSRTLASRLLLALSLTISLPIANALLEEEILAQSSCFGLGHFYFYEGNNGSQDMLGSGVHNCYGWTYPLKKLNTSGVPNDEARSVRLEDIKAGTTLYVYDDPGCRPSDDYAVIAIKKYVDETVLNTFQQTHNWGDIDMRFYRKNGLDGKISCIRVQVK